MTKPSPVLELKNLRVSLSTGKGQRQIDVVRGIDLVIGPSETLGIVGESGSGKTLTALAIAGLLPESGVRVTGGEIRFHSADLLKMSSRQMRQVRGRRIGYVFQNPMTALNPAHRIGDQIVEAIREHLGMTQRQATVRAVELLDAVGIPNPRSRARDYPHHLSGGMRQRVVIALAISCDPDLLIADEPTTALDVTVQAQILDLLGELSSRHSTSLVLISHDLGVVARLAGRIAVMYAGRIVEDAPAASILGGPRHPYSTALLKCAPRANRPPQGRLASIGGEPPSPGSLPRGCSFRPRCGHAMAICAEDPPQVRNANTVTECWLGVAEAVKNG